MSSTSLTDLERVTGVLGDAADQLQSLQAISPSPALEAVRADVLFARDSLARITAAHLDVLEAFARDHPVDVAYDPGRFEVEF